MIFLFWVLFVIAVVFEFPFAAPALVARNWIYLAMLGMLGLQSFGFPH
jgi:hypothetical protein